MPDPTHETLITVFPDHPSADAAVKALIDAGFDGKNLSVAGQSYHHHYKVVGYESTDERIAAWSSRGAFWGGLWGLLLGGLFLTIPVAGHIVVLGYLGATAVAAVDGALLAGGLSALGAALYSLGVPKDSIPEYESELEADKFLVMVHGGGADLGKARGILETLSPVRIDLHRADPELVSHTNIVS